MTKKCAITSLPHDPARDMNPLFGTPIIDQGWKRLINDAVPQNELASLVETVFSKENITDLVDLLQGEHVQIFIDVIDTVWHHALQPPEDGLTDSAYFLYLLGTG